MDTTSKIINPLVSTTFEVSKTEENRRSNGKKEQDKQKAINDVIQLNEEAGIKLAE